MDLSNFNTKNPKKLYEFNKFKFLYENCDTVIINGERFGNTQWEKLERFAMRFPDENGNPNIKTLEFDYKIGGLDFDERDFIDYEIENLNKVYDKLLERLNQSYQRTLNGTAPILYLPKRKEIYLNYLKSLKRPKIKSNRAVLKESFSLPAGLTPTEREKHLYKLWDTFNLFLDGTNKNKIDFDRIFSGNEIPEDKKVNWKDSVNISDIKAFTTLIGGRKRNKYKRAEHCFLRNGESITAEQLQNANIDKKSQKFAKAIRACENLYPKR